MYEDITCVGILKPAQGPGDDCPCTGDLQLTSGSKGRRNVFMQGTINLYRGVGLWKPLQQRRSDIKLAMVYRITHGLVDIPASAYFHPVTSSTRGHSLRYFQQYCRTKVYLHSFFPSGIRLWNQLPESIVTSETLEDFKRGLASLH